MGETFPGIRSLSLDTMLGFDPRELLARMNGPTIMPMELRSSVTQPNTAVFQLDGLA